jgi:hypothetical protein
MSWTVGELARLAGVTVRTLHHYDRIGLVRPSARTSAGYRSYDVHDLDRLQQVLVYRELGFPLEEVGSTGCCGTGSSAPRPWSRPSRRRWRHGRWGSP